MLKQKLKNHHIILASGSPRRQKFFQELDIPVTIDVRKVNEVYPQALKKAEITDYLSQLKAAEFDALSGNDILITSDTIVWKENSPMEKPRDAQHAKQMIKSLSGNVHEVITSVCFTGASFQKTVNETTKVWFATLTDDEVNYYVDTFQPFDKAGAYGIQEWIGYIGVEKIEGSFFNVMGLPTRLVYKTLLQIAEKAN